MNSEAPSSPSEATSEKDANSVSQSNAVSSKKEEERSNSVKKVIRVEIHHVFSTFGHKGALQCKFWSIEAIFFFWFHFISTTFC